MKRLLPVVLMSFFAAAPLPGTAEETVADPLFVDVTEVDLKQFKWKKRPLVVFADTPDDPMFIEQLELLRSREAAMRERDVVVITDTDPDAESDLRRKLRPRGFMLVIINKEGTVNVRKPFPWDGREISRSIDKMPIRQREIREAKERARADGTN
ncbi:DUF4174 domain-containing protein [Roseobacter sp.]|uniref:DUF4174 domain-containing protein n=1 Tax=Roseobacter sp. TaxID=1907202 RepID=UPI0025F85595|nr:DUF4174 domain-containing protein [Roseobacter sp.]